MSHQTVRTTNLDLACITCTRCEIDSGSERADYPIADHVHCATCDAGIPSGSPDCAWCGADRGPLTMAESRAVARTASTNPHAVAFLAAQDRKAGR